MAYFLSAVIIVLIIPVWGCGMYGIKKGLCRLTGNLVGGKGAYLILNYLTFVGVIHHELSHALFALLTGAHVTEVAIFQPSGNSLGHVNYATRGGIPFSSLQHYFTAVGPVVMGTVTSVLIMYGMTVWRNPLMLILFAYLLFSVLVHATMSPPDVLNMLRGILPVFILVLIGCIALKITPADLLGYISGLWHKVVGLKESVGD